MHTSKFYAAAVGATAVFAVVLFAVFSLTRPAIEPFPLDWGWVGFVFIFGNGFFLSYCLLNKKVGVLDRLLLTLGSGFGVTFIVMILLGVLWQITLTTVLTTQIILLATAGIFAYLRGLKLPHFTLEPKELQIKRQNLLQAFLLAIIGVLAFAALYDTLSLPATDWDSLAYGVNYAKIIFQNSHIPLIAGPSIGIEMSAPYPPGVQLAAVNLYAFAGEANDFYYRILSPIFSFAILLVTYKFAMLLNNKNRTFSVFAVSALVMIPFFWELFIQETYLMALTFMLTSSAYFFYKAYQSESADAKKYEVIGVLFCSFAALTSYIGVLAFGVLLLYAVHKKITIKRVALLLGLGVVVALPWFLRNLVLLGNPVYPFLGIGSYLDPLLRSSTALHFENYTMLPLYGWSTLVCRVGVFFVVAAIVFFTFSKRREFRLALPLYLLLASIAIMAFHVAFPRYLILAFPILAVIFSTLFTSIPKTHRLPQLAAVVFIAVMVLTSLAMLPYINSVKPPRESGETQADYLSRIYEEGDAWQWINQNTPTNTRIATFDIKGYYLNRDVFYLDGNESAPLYQMDTIEDCLSFLRGRGVGYVLSVPWASPFDNRMPPAYEKCPLTNYIGDLDYLPPVFSGENGTTVYHVGALSEDAISQAFAAKSLVAPIKDQTLNLTIYDNIKSTVAACNVSIPVDYRTGYIKVSINSTANSTSGLFLELWNGIIPSNQIKDPHEDFYMNGLALTENFIINSTSQQSEKSTLIWKIDKAGYFTIRVCNKTVLQEVRAINVTLDLTFYTASELASGSAAVMFSGVMPTLMRGLIPIMSVPVNSTLVINANAKSFGSIAVNGSSSRSESKSTYPVSCTPKPAIVIGT